MSNLAMSHALAEIPAEISTAPAPVSKRIKAKAAPGALSYEDEQIVAALYTVKSDLDSLHNRYDHTTDPMLLESIIYELKAANIKFVYFLNLCKDRGICCQGIT